jgi:hypothetical protein
LDSEELIERFYEHAYKNITNKSHREVQLRRRMLQYGVQHFIILGLEQVNSAATNGTYKIHQLREQYWQSKLQGLKNGYNSIRVIKEKSNNKSRHVNIAVTRRFGQRDYTLKAQHLVTYWTERRGVLHDDFFQHYLTKKLVAFITIYATYTANTPGYTLSKRLQKEVKSRHYNNTINDSNNKNGISKNTNRQQSISCVLPYTSSVWNKFQLQRVLKNGITKAALPVDSILGKRKLLVFHKYDIMSRQQVCNYTEITKATALTADDFPCYCSNKEYADLVDHAHKHILTCNMELLNNNNRLAGDFLKLGTKYRDKYCPDNRPDKLY